MRRVSRLLLGIVTTAVPVVIAACYGMAYTFSQRGHVIDKASKAGVAGLRVDCLSSSKNVSDTTLTSSTGAFELYASGQSACQTVAVTDERSASPSYAPTSVPSNSSADLIIEVSTVP
jgi:hypothetical protein